MPNWFWSNKLCFIPRLVPKYITDDQGGFWSFPPQIHAQSSEIVLTGFMYLTSTTNWRYIRIQSTHLYWSQIYSVHESIVLLYYFIT